MTGFISMCSALPVCSFNGEARFWASFQSWFTVTGPDFMGQAHLLQPFIKPVIRY
jgi:hypothetical protein